MHSNFILKIKNYQIIRDASFEFVPGLNCIVGQTNNGKSSVIRAVETAIFNIPRMSHVTQGESVSAVGIKYKNNSLIWRRDTKAASQVSYKWNGQVLTKVGRGQPEFIAKAFGIKEVELDGTIMRLNFQKQMAYPFLLDKTPSQLFKFIVQSSEEDNLMDVIDLMKKDLQAITVSIKSNEKAQEEVGKSLASVRDSYNFYKGAHDICESILGYESRIKEYLRVSEMSESLKDGNTELIKIKDALTSCEEVIKNISPRYESAMKNIALLENLKTLVEDIKSKEKDNEVFHNQLDKIDRDISNIGDLSLVSSIIGRVEGKQKSLDNLTSLVTRLKESIKDKQSTTEGISLILSQIDGISSVEGKSSTLDSVETLTGLVYFLKEGLYQMKDIQSILKRVETEYSEVIKVLNEEFKSCPYCGAPLEKSKEVN